MIKVEKTLNVNKNARQLFDIVRDVNEYHNFIPWCERSNVISNKKDEIIADLTISFKVFSFTYRSNVSINEDSLTINVSSQDGPFKNLNTEWKFKQISESSSRVYFAHQMNINNFLMKKAAQISLPLATEMIMKSFLKRANDLNC